MTEAVRSARGRWLALALFLLASGVGVSVAEAASPPTDDYHYWVMAEWQWRLSLPATASKRGECITRSQNGPVWFLDSSDTGSASSVTCVIPAGRSIMLDTPSVNCFALEHGRGPTPDAVLQRCARRLWQRHTGALRLTIDGRVVRPGGYVVGTAAFAFTQPAHHNFLGTAAATHGWAAVYGSASILSPLSRGMHTLVMQLLYSHTGVGKQVTYHLTVR